MWGSRGAIDCQVPGASQAGSRSPGIPSGTGSRHLEQTARPAMTIECAHERICV